MTLKNILFACGVLCCCVTHAGEKPAEKLAEKPAETPVKPATKPATNSAEAPTKPAPVADAKLSRELTELGAGDPFRYSVSGTDDYSPSANNRVVTGIIVKGIVRLKGDTPPSALLHLAESNRSFYVRKGDVIRVPNPKNGNAMTEMYLQVKDIRDDEVEVIQKERPDRVIIVR